MKHLLAAIAAAAFVAGAAISPVKAMDQKPHSAKSIECSKRADAKGLHGKARHKFRSECKRGKV
jgi:hypothetical protein